MKRKIINLCLQFAAINLFFVISFFSACKNDEDNKAPTMPVGTYPPQGAIDIYDAELTWTASIDPDGDPITYDVFLSTSSDIYSTLTGKVASNLTSASYAYTVDHSSQTSYYWFVMAKDNHNHATKGILYTFISKYLPTGPNKPILTYPANGATNIDYQRSLRLYWSYSGMVDNFEILFGTTSSPDNIGSAYSYERSFYLSSSKLAPNTTYYWRVEAWNPLGYGFSDIFSFKTTP